MTGKERFFAALERRQPDRVPIAEWVIDQKVIDQIYPNCSYTDFVEKMELDAISNNEAYDYWNAQVLDEGKNIIRNKWGVIERFTKEKVYVPLEGPIKSEQDLKRYIPPDPWDKSILGELPKIAERYKKEKAIFWLTNDAFSIPWRLRGMENLLMDYVVNPHLAKEVTGLCVEYNMQAALNALNHGAEVIMLGDDYAGKDGPFMSPLHFKEFILPGLKKIVRAIKKNGGYVVKHTDGNIWPLIDMIVDTGIDALHPLEPRAGMDIGKVKQLYGDRICVVGNIDSAYTLSFGSSKDVVREVKECILKASIGGGHIMMSSNSIHSGVKPDNYVSMVKATKKYGQYPIDTKKLRSL